MLVKEQPITISPRPKSFAALMEMYETNYLQLRLLCGDLRTLDRQQTSTIPNGIPVLLKVIEHSAHTTTVLLTYIFQDTCTHHAQKPDMLIRVYHDARQAEVMSHRCRLNEDIVSTKGQHWDTMLLCRWRMNRFLFKWINYLRRQGHTFIN